MDPLEQPNNVDLLAALTGPAVAQRLLNQYERLSDLSQATFDELQHHEGIGKSKAAAIRAAFLLGQRLSRERFAESPQLDNPERVADLLREQNRSYTVENLQVVLVNTRRRLIGVSNISQGTLDTLLVHAREVFSVAIAKKASAIILAHNHPSGDPAPSQADIKITRDLVRAGQLLKIEVLDHIILGRSSNERLQDFISLRELGYLSQ